MTFENITANVIAVVLVVMILAVFGVVWVWGMALLLAQVVRTMNHIRHGAPDVKYLRRMEKALFADNLTRAMERAREEKR